MPMKNLEYDYALLRGKKERMPSWSSVIGLHKVIINEEMLERMYPRLGYKKKLGSFFAHPYSDKKEEQVSRFTSYLKEMLS